jgi:hypothetical protein
MSNLAYEDGDFPDAPKPKKMKHLEEPLDLEMYDRVCQSRFNKLEDKVDILHAVVTDGLADKVEASRKLSWWAIGLFFTGFGVVVAMLLKLFALFYGHLAG